MEINSVQEVSGSFLKVNTLNKKKILTTVMQVIMSSVYFCIHMHYYFMCIYVLFIYRVFILGCTAVLSRGYKQIMSGNTRE